MGKSGSPQVTDAREFEELVSVENLGIVWRKLKPLIRETSARDCIDLLDWQTTVEQRLPKIRDELLAGVYEPQAPARFRIPKSQGSFRTMTCPALADLLIYRLIAEVALAKGLSQKVPGAFFVRSKEVHPIGPTLSFDASDYPTFMEVWLHYQEYRSQTLLSDPTAHLVVTDISNFFDSVSHEMLLEYLAPLGLPRKMVGTLGRLLETLKPATSHSRNPGIGIPTDEFDCSRTFAHLFLFEHDARMVSLVGPDYYVRWMDDQNVGVATPAEGRRIVHRMTESLASQRLTLNAGKTRIMTNREAFEHFQIEANVLLNGFQEKYWSGRKPYEKPDDPAAARLAFQSLWDTLVALRSMGRGNWDKILKRCYKLAGRLGSNVMDYRVREDLVHYPTLAPSLFACLAQRDEAGQLMDLMDWYVEANENMHPAVEAAFFEAVCLSEPSGETVARLRAFILRYLQAHLKPGADREPGTSAALLCAYWYSVPATDLEPLIGRGDAPYLPASLCRAWLATVTAGNPPGWVRYNRRLLGSPSQDVMHLADFLADIRTGAAPKIPAFLNPRWNHQRCRNWFEPRTWLQAEIAMLGPPSQITNYVRNRMRHLSGSVETWMEQEKLDRIAARLSAPVAPARMSVSPTREDSPSVAPLS